MKPYIIRVKGDIIVHDLTHYAQEWDCYGYNRDCSMYPSYSFDEVTHSVNGNLVLDSSVRAVPYAVYVAENDISCRSGDISVSPGVYAAYYYYIYNISQVKEQLKINEINPILIQPLYR